MGGTFVHDQAKHLVDAGCRIKVMVLTAYCPGVLMNLNRWNKYGRIPKHDIIDGIPVYYPRYYRLPGKWFHPLSCYTEYNGLRNTAHSIIEEFKPDVIHAHAATPAGFVGLLLKNRYGLPLVCSLRGSDVNVYPHYGKLSMRLTEKVITRADRLVSVSNALKTEAGFIAKAKKDISVVYNGCDNDIFTVNREFRQYSRKILGIPEAAKVLIFAGDISIDKGIVELIEAFKKVRSKKANLHLVLIGAPKGSQETKTLTRITGSMNGSLHMTGRLEHLEIPRYLNAGDIFVLPSHSEGLPNAILEAMACSLPVIATRVGGIPEAVEDGKSGILTEKKDTNSLARAMEYLIENGVAAKEMGVYGRKIMESRFSWKKNAQKIIEIYREII